MHQPLVSCLMPTYNRREFVPHAIRYFLRQDYPRKELLIIDDGTDSIQDLVPDHDTIRYIRLPAKQTLGAKLNLSCSHAQGDMLMNWDDDDWYASRRITYQVKALQEAGTDVCGINQLLYYDLRTKRAHQYLYPPDQRVWLLGSSLCYRAELWQGNRFAEIDVGMDGLFVWATPPNRVTVLNDATFAVHMIHDQNVSPKQTNGWGWHPYSVDVIHRLLDTDLRYYHHDDVPVQPAPQSRVSVVQTSLAAPPIRPVKNIYACLVHEQEDCIIDLVQNLHYHDPTSTILLYNGSQNPNLIRNQAALEQAGAVVHPTPGPVKHGYLHSFALNSMAFSLDNFAFDTMTFVDSDQLALQRGYVDLLSTFLADKPTAGLLSSRPQRVEPGTKEVWPAIQAFAEYELWKPFLQTFAQGEDKFVHWTFWPSTVFTADATRDLTRLFQQNRQLQDIMRQTQIWATEEVILPTLVRLLGYDIVANPCDSEFVNYRKAYTLQDIQYALNKPNAYWIHPIERTYENPLRAYTRQHAKNYIRTGQKDHAPQTIPMSSTLALLDTIQRIEGWFDTKEADLLISAALKACFDFPSGHALVEIGSYHGKSTVLLGSVVKTCSPASKVYAIDPHEGVVGAADQGLQSLPPSLQTFKHNMTKAGVADVVELIQEYSFNVHWEQPISLLFIDGLHDYGNVAQDFRHFADWISPGGYVAFHDYADYYPGVIAFVNELLMTSTYQKIQQASSLILLQKL